MASTSAVIWGPLLDAAGSLPISLPVRCCDLRPRFLAKGTVGRGHRAVARNGRVLLASDVPLAELADQVVRLRFQKWHKTILPGDRPAPWGVLLCARRANVVPEYLARLTPRCEERFDLALDVGGGMMVLFQRIVS